MYIFCCIIVSFLTKIGPVDVMSCSHNTASMAAQLQTLKVTLSVLETNPVIKSSLSNQKQKSGQGQKESGVKSLLNI